VNPSLYARRQLPTLSTVPVRGLHTRRQMPRFSIVAEFQ
jgi:hypothetical protein